MPKARLERKSLRKMLKRKIMDRQDQFRFPGKSDEIDVGHKKIIHPSEHPVGLGIFQVPEQKIQKLVGIAECLQLDVGIILYPSEIGLAFLESVKKKNIPVAFVLLKNIF